MLQFRGIELKTRHTLGKLGKCLDAMILFTIIGVLNKLRLNKKVTKKTYSNKTCSLIKTFFPVFPSNFYGYLL